MVICADGCSGRVPFVAPPLRFDGLVHQSNARAGWSAVVKNLVQLLPSKKEVAHSNILAVLDIATPTQCWSTSATWCPTCQFRIASFGLPDSVRLRPDIVGFQKLTMRTNERTAGDEYEL